MLFYPIGKIIQIIPAPAELWAWYEDDQGGRFCERVTCLALEEYSSDAHNDEKGTCITAYSAGVDGLIERVDTDNFIGFTCSENKRP